MLKLFVAGIILAAAGITVLSVAASHGNQRIFLTSRQKKAQAIGVIFCLMGLLMEAIFLGKVITAGMAYVLG